MSKICTSIEQSRKLIELGLSVDTADMWWNIDIVDKFGIDSYSDVPSCYNVSDTATPAWSLSALLGLMPNATLMMKDHENGKDFSYCFCIAKHKEFISDNPLDAAFEMVCWLLKNKKI